MVRFHRFTVWFGAAVVTLGVVLVAAPVGLAQAAPVARSTALEAGIGAQPAGCARGHGTQSGHCYLAVEPAGQVIRASAQTTTSCPVDESSGYTPCNLQSAYGLTSQSATDGVGSTVAVVDPNDDPNAESDLGQYRATYGLPPCTTADGCFEKVNQEGVEGSYPSPDQGDAQEISLDLDMVSAICPNCHILLVEANSNGFSDLGTAENEAVALGARVVSNSWGTGDFDGESGFDGDFDHPGVAITFSSGDGAYQGGVQYPSASPYVTSVGGTMLTPASNTRGWTESTWDTPGSPSTQGSGSGCSAFEPKPPWQTDSGCANRMTADVSAVAANVLSYDTYPSGGWFFSFGTSVSSPIIAGIYGLADNPASITIPASVAYKAPAADLHDITTGNTGTCSPTYFCKAAKGYDGPTGLGTPNGIGAFVVPGTPPPAITGFTVTGPGSDPTVTVTGSHFGTEPPIGTPESCQSGDTGDDFGSSGLSIDDVTQAWTAGQAGDCIGLIVESWSSAKVVFGFGNQYDNYPPLSPGDQIQLQVQGAPFFTVAPSVTSITPTSGPTTGGTSVTINGTGFTGATKVAFGTVSATFTVVSDSQITAVSPAEATGAKNVVVTRPGGTSPAVAGDKFTFKLPPPSVTSITPTSGPTTGGTSVTINGTGFTGATKVAFGTVSATFTVVSDSQITAVSPAEAAGTKNVFVTRPGGTSPAVAGDKFTFK